MFWGLIMEPNKRYTQTVDKSFHVSMASLDLSTADDQTIQVMLCLDGRNFLLCSLNKSKTWQVPLDLNFQEGTNIAFTCNGRGNVHLTGYLISEDDFDGLEEEDEDEESIPQLLEKNTKRKASNSLKEGKNIKRAKSDDTSSEDDDDDDDVDLLGDQDDDSEDSEEEEEEDENITMDDDEDDDSDDIDDDEDESDDEEEEQMQDKKQKAKKKDKSPNPVNKQQQQQQQQNKQQNQQPKKKEDKQKMVNGTDNKQDHQSKKQKKNKPDQQQQQQNQNQNQQQNAQNEQKKRVVEGGVQVEDLKIGNGTLAKPGKFVSVYYVGRLKNGKKFDATTQGDGFKFRLGKGEVIKGWDIGVAGMKVGGKRRLVIPPAMAYGAKGSPPVIPGNSQLTFEVELRNVH